MSLFGRMTGDRFEKEQEESMIGPGSYELPTSLDDHGARITGPDRFVDADGVDTPGPGFYAEAADKEEKTKALTRTPSKKRGLSSKENRSAMTPRALQEKATTPVAESKPASRKSVAMSAEAREVEQLKRQLNHEEKLRVSAESKAAELSAAKKWAAEAQVQVQSKEHKISNMQSKIEELTAKCKDAQTKVREMEAHGGGARKAMLEKENATAALNKGLEQQKTVSAKLKDQLDKAEAELKHHKSEKSAALEELGKMEEASRAEMAAKITQLKGEQDEKAKLTQELAAALEKVAKLAEELTNIRADLQNERDQAKTEMASAMRRLEAEHEANIAAQAQETSSKAEALVEMSSSSEQEIARIRAAHEDAQKTLQEEMAKAEALAKIALEEAEKSNATAIEEVKLNAEKEIAAILSKQQDTTGRFAEETAKLEREAAAALTDVVAATQKLEEESAKVQAAEEFGRNALKEAEAASAQAIEDVKLNAEKQIARTQSEQQEEHAAAVASITQKHASELDEVKAALAKQAQEHATAAAATAEDHEKGLAAAKEVVAKALTAELAQANDAIKRVEQEKAMLAETAAATQAEVAAANQTLQEENAKLLETAATSQAEATVATQKLQEENAKLLEAAATSQTEAAAANHELQEENAKLLEAAATSQAEAAAGNQKLQEENAKLLETAATSQAEAAAANQTLQEENAKLQETVTTSQAEAAAANQKLQEEQAKRADADEEAKAHALKQEEKIQRCTEWREQEREQLQQALATTSHERDTAVDEKNVVLKEYQDCKQALANERADKESLVADGEQLQQDRERILQELAEERTEKQSLQDKLINIDKEQLEKDVEHDDKIKSLERALAEKSGNGEEEELTQKVFDLEMQVNNALSKCSESEGALKDAQARLEETTKNEAALKAELAKIQAEDSRIRKEEKARYAELQENEQTLRAEVDKLGFAEKKSQMFEGAKKKAELESKDLKKEVEQLRLKLADMAVDAEKLQKLEEHAALRDNEAAELQQQNASLLKSLQYVEKDYEACLTDNRSLQENLLDNEADLEHTKDENAKLMGHTNHKQKVQYHIKIKDENAQLKQELTKIKQRLSQYEVGARGSSLLEALATLGGGSNNSVGEVCGQSVCSTREPRTPNPKGASSQASVRTPKRPTSNGPPQSGRRGQANVEAERCQNCELQERAKERAFVDFQHVVSLIDRAAFNGDIISGPNSDPTELIEKLRNMGAATPATAGAQAPQTPKPARAAWQAEDGAD